MLITIVVQFRLNYCIKLNLINLNSFMINGCAIFQEEHLGVEVLQSY